MVLLCFWCLESIKCSNEIKWRKKPEYVFIVEIYVFSPEAAVAFEGVEAAAWIRAWGGIRMVARGGLLDNSREKVRHLR